MEFKIITKEQQTEILTENYGKCAGWGWFYPATAEGAFGARLIMDNCGLSAVPGRVGWSGFSPPVTEMFNEENILDLLFKFLKEQGITGSSSDIVYGEFKSFKLLATPNESYGYVYLSCWR